MCGTMYYSHTHTQAHTLTQSQFASSVGFWFWGICHLTELPKSSLKIIRCLRNAFLFLVTRKHNLYCSLFFWLHSYGGFSEASFQEDFCGVLSCISTFHSTPISRESYLQSYPYLPLLLVSVNLGSSIFPQRKFLSGLPSLCV